MTPFTELNSFCEPLHPSPLPETLHKQAVDLDLITCCVNELCTIHRNGIPWPLIYGIGINVKSGEIFPATFTDKGPDLDIRNARTLTGGENVGVRGRTMSSMSPSCPLAAALIRQMELHRFILTKEMTSIEA